MDAIKFIHNFINEIECESTSDLDHSETTENFQKHLNKEVSNETFIELLIYSGYIPDIYRHDSSEEKLHTKLTEAMVAEWAKRLGFKFKVISQKSGKEDVKININNKIIVADAKSFRLGRSQSAPNPKDFVKLEQVKTWMSRYKNSIGGLITFPYTHDWSSYSNVYEECSNKEAPTLMLYYIHMAYLLKYKDNYNTNNLLNLWDYNKLFPNVLSADSRNNKDPYWEKIDNEIIEITNTDSTTYYDFISDSKTLKNEYIQNIVANLEELIKRKKSELLRNVEKKSKEEIAKLYVDLKAEDLALETTIKRIQKFRL